MGSTHTTEDPAVDRQRRRAEWVGGDPLSSHSMDEENRREAPTRARILVVEDEHLVALDIQLRLEKMGHEPHVAYSGEEALQMACEHDFDLVLMDIKLKGELDGIEAARKIRASYDVPIIYVTAYADAQTLDRARLTEPYGYVLKPFQERELKAAIEMALQRHGSDRLRWEQQQLQRFLAEASARLAATLDYRAVAMGAADLIVPRYADWCTIHLRGTHDLVPAFTYTRPNSDGRNATPPPGRLIETVQNTGSSEILTHISDPGSLADGLGQRHIDMLRDLGARSLICVPLPAREQILGALAIVSGRGRPRYTVKELIFIEDFGRRLAMALDNALLYRAAERAIRMRDDVLAIVSHDLRTPLATVLMQADLLTARDDFGREGLAKVATTITRAAHRMDRLIDDLLDASAINAGSLALDIRSHNAVEVAREALESFRSAPVSLVHVLPDRPVPVLCDRDRVIQVLSNLLGNAIKFTPPEGGVTLRVERIAGRVRFQVEDTGPGIAPEQLPHLFDRFWRGQTGNEGAGLGLFISRGIVAAHGSTLGVDSTPGAGSRFYFELAEAPS